MKSVLPHACQTMRADVARSTAIVDHTTAKTGPGGHHSGFARSLNPRPLHAPAAWHEVCRGVL